jgi:hypothetical protein
MYQTIVVIVHATAAAGALIAGGLALTFPNGTPRHRLAGKLYLLCWSLLVVGGALIGSWHPGFSIFQVMNLLGFSSVLIAYSAIALRRQIGPAWLHHHFNWMVTSMAFLVVGTSNVVMRHAFGGAPMWLFVLTAIAAAPTTSWYVRKLDRRYGQLRERPAGAAAEPSH